MIGLLLTCKGASRAAASGLYEDGPVWARWAVRLHLATCRNCRKFLRQMRLLGTAARLRSRSLLSPAEAERFVQATLEKAKSW